MGRKDRDETRVTVGVTNQCLRLIDASVRNKITEE